MDNMCSFHLRVIQDLLIATATKSSAQTRCIRILKIFFRTFQQAKYPDVELFKNFLSFRTTSICIRMDFTASIWDISHALQWFSGGWGARISLSCPTELDRVVLLNYARFLFNKYSTVGEVEVRVFE